MTIPFTWLRAQRAVFAQNDMCLCVLQHMVAHANIIVDVRLGVSRLIEGDLRAILREVHH